MTEPMTDVSEIHMRAVAFPEGDAWIVQGLEYDICAHAEQVEDLPNAFLRAVVETLCITEQLGKAPLGGIRPAPARFHALFDRAKMHFGPVGPAPAGLTGGNLDMRLLSVV